MRLNLKSSGIDISSKWSVELRKICAFNITYEHAPWGNRIHLLVGKLFTQFGVDFFQFIGTTSLSPLLTPSFSCGYYSRWLQTAFLRAFYRVTDCFARHIIARHIDNGILLTCARAFCLARVYMSIDINREKMKKRTFEESFLWILDS